MEFIPGTHGWFSVWKSVNVIQQSNEIQDRNNYVIILIDAEKVFYKNPTPFMIEKNTQKTKNE